MYHSYLHVGEVNVKRYVLIPNYCKSYVTCGTVLINAGTIVSVVLRTGVPATGLALSR